VKRSSCEKLVGLSINLRKEMSRERNPVRGIMKFPSLFVLIG
jgi:hypothetical protein